MRSSLLRKPNILLCFAVIILPLLTQANQIEVPEEDGTCGAPLSRNGDVSASGSVLATGTVGEGTDLRPFRNWQEYLLDMGDGRNINQKLAYLFEHQNEFGLNMTHFTEGTFHTKDNLIRKGGYAIHLHPPSVDLTEREKSFIVRHWNRHGRYLYRPSSFLSEKYIFVSHNGDVLFMNVVESDYSYTHIVSDPHTDSVKRELKLLNRLFDHLNDRGMNTGFLDETVESRRFLIEAVVERTGYPHVRSPELFTRGTDGRIVQREIYTATSR